MNLKRLFSILIICIIMVTPFYIIAYANESPGQYMLHVNATGGSTKPLQKTAELTKGKTYVATFKYKVVSGSLDKDFYFCVCKAQQVVENVTGKGKRYFDSHLGQFDSVSNVDGVSQLEYTFTLTDRDGVTFESGTSKYDIGFYFESGKKSEVYVADFSVYEETDALKENLLTVPDYSKKMYGWHSDYFAADENSTTFSNSAYTAECVVYDDSMFISDLTGNYMLHVNATGGSTKPLQKTAELTKGKTYVATFKYKVVSGLLDKDFYFCVCQPQQVVKNVTGSGKRFFDSHLGQFDSVNTVDGVSQLEYTFTLTDRDGITFESGTAKYDIGFYFESGKQSNVYIADFSVYELTDNTKKNLLLVPSYSKGMYGWHSDYHSADSGTKIFENSAYTAEYVKYDASYFELELTGNYMLHVNATGGSTKPLQKTAELTKGKTYVATFKYKVVSGLLDKDFYFCVCQPQQVVKNVTGSGKRFFDSHLGQFDSVNTVDGVSQLEYTFTLTDRDGITFESGTSLYDIGFQFENGKKSEIYIADFLVYELTDALKKNKLIVADYSKGLLGWHSDYQAAAENSTNFSNSAYSAEYVEYDESLFIDSNTEANIKNHMLHARGNGASTKVLQKTANLTKGKSYTVSFKYKFLDGDLDKSLYFIVSVPQSVVNNTNQNKGKKYFDSHLGQFDSVEKSKDFSEIKYTFTFEDKSFFTSGLTIPTGTSQVDIGFCFEAKRTTEVYIADFVVYETSDTNKKNLLLVPDYSKGLYGWHSDYQAVDENAETFENSVYAIDYTEYAETIFEFPKSVHSMIHVTSTGKSTKPLQKTAMLTKGQTYIASFNYVMKSGNFDSGVYFCVTRPQQVVENVTGKGKMYFDSHLNHFETVVNDEETFSATYTFTFEDKGHMTVDVPEGTSKVDVGFIFEGGKSVDMYIADFTIYDSSDVKKTNLLIEPDYAKGLYGWHSDYQEAQTDSKSFENSGYTVICMEYDASVFSKPSVVKYPEQICYFQNGSGWRAFAALAKVTIGKTYYFECSISSSFRLPVYASTTGARDIVVNNAPVIEMHEYEDYYHAVYAITIPEKSISKGAPMTEKAFVGIQMPSNSSGYIFDIHFYDSEDLTKKELFSNPDFKCGLDDFIFDWRAWFIEGRQGLGVREWSEGSNALKLFDYDLKKIIRYINDSKFSDGEWWNPKDIANDFEEETAVVKGTLANQSRNSLASVKICLSSNNMDYTTQTNFRGMFELRNIVPDFYELFTIDNNGTRYSTGFFTNIQSGDKYELNIVCDNSKEGIIETSIEDEPRGSITGNLYTPNRKPVSNFKVYLRNIGESTTDKEGYFEFCDVPVGTYDLYTISATGKEVILKTVTVKENVKAQLKLKYETETKDTATDIEKGIPIFIYFAIAASVLVIAAGITVVLLVKRKKKTRRGI